jgi:hypothetical protein
MYLSEVIGRRGLVKRKWQLVHCQSVLKDLFHDVFGAQAFAGLPLDDSHVTDQNIAFCEGDNWHSRGLKMIRPR